MRILVTGGAGYIGSHTVVELLSKGFDATVIDNLSNSSEESLNRVRKLTGREVEFIRGDVRDKALLDSIFESHEIAGVIHFAGLKAVGESVQKPVEYYTNNLDSTLVLIQSMREHGCRNIRFLCIIAAPEGLSRLQKEHPDVDIVVGALDDHLNENGYIVPGLGDAGDRIFGTK